MDENEITQRLRDAGDQPVPGEVRASHLSQMHGATPAAAPQPKRFGRLAVAAAAFVGFAVGSTGFAMAGALPDPAQNVAHDVLAIVNVNVEKPANRGQCISGVARSDLTPEEKQVEKQKCKDSITPGRPDHAGPGNGKAKGRPDGIGPPEGHPNDNTGDCKGKPPWAGKDGASYPADKKAEFNRNCGRDVDDDPEEIKAEEIEPAPGAEQGQADPQGEAPAEAPAGPPADGAPGQQDDAPAPPVDVPAPIESETDTETETETETG